MEGIFDKWIACKYMRFEMPFRRKSEPTMPERRMPSRASVTPDGLGGEGIPIDASSKPVQFKGYTTIDGAVIDGRTEVEQFNAARGFNRIDGSVGQAAVPKTPGGEMVPEVPDNSEADLVRQQALKMPEGLQGEELLVVLEQKTREFTAYFDQKWKGKKFENNPERDADLDCLAKLQGRAAAARVKKMRLEKITNVEMGQIRADIEMEQRKLLQRFSDIPSTEEEYRRNITMSIRELGHLLKSGTEAELRAWSDSRMREFIPLAQSRDEREVTEFGQTSTDSVLDSDSDWSKQ